MKIVATKYNVIYEDKNGSYHNALLSCPPSERTKKELGIVNIISIEPTKIVVNDTDIQCRDIPTYKNPK